MIVLLVFVGFLLVIGIIKKLVKPRKKYIRIPQISKFFDVFEKRNGGWVARGEDGSEFVAGSWDELKKKVKNFFRVP